MLKKIKLRSERVALKFKVKSQRQIFLSLFFSLLLREGEMARGARGLVKIGTPSPIVSPLLSMYSCVGDYNSLGLSFLIFIMKKGGGCN